MSRDKQIDDLAEEIRKTKEYLTDRCGNTYGERRVGVSHSERIAEHLLEVGYRKASDVAREILALVWDAYQTTHYDAEFEERLDEIEKKYESEGEK